MSDGTAALAPHEIALLRGGPRAAVTVALVALHLRRLAEPGRPGTVRAVPRDAATAELTSSFEDLIYGALLDRPLRPRRIVRHPDVRLAVALVRVPLAEAGLLRWPFLGPTRAARREVAALRARHRLPVRRHGLTDHDKLLAVALHGEAALKALVPRFAYRTGLLPRVEVTDVRGTGPSWGYGGAASFCGGGDGGGSD
ncbi:TIGR04222 domain-containing membrane protein [Streptomyces sp. JB150]|uniref:TIGR04222 domain-containing membrane protein n=1 Tax=Streptomyces sp. JB150 TaxID=2714844 RepID=UPI00140DBD3E|nr:TIGR04222 domain-containing membrane protein [Streptomyces sp. JB150]QIJ65485.1 TIGR04222 domain-containing membrane protein [Streptomyces sp. JB150]